MTVHNNLAAQAERHARLLEEVSAIIREAIDASEEAEPYEFYEADWAAKILDAVDGKKP